MCHLVVSLSAALLDIVTTTKPAQITLCMSIHSISSLISYLMAFRADFWFDCSETVMNQLMDFSRHRGRAGPSATAHNCYSTRCCAAANGSVTAAMTCLSSPTCSTPLMMSFSIASKLTLITSSRLTFLTRLTFRISSVIAHTTLL